MLEVLRAVEGLLPEMLVDEAGWSSLDIDYQPPRVERLYRSYGVYRISLHCIHPCQEGEALFHPHPWPSAMRVLSGRYEMGIGYGPGDRAPEVAAKLIADAPFSYEMTARDGWHWVRPVGGPAWSLMVTGSPWGRWSPGSARPLSALPAARVTEMLARVLALL